MFAPASIFPGEEFDSVVLLTHGGKRQHHDTGMPNVICVTQVRTTEYLIKQLNCPNCFDNKVTAEPAK